MTFLYKNNAQNRMIYHGGGHNEDGNARTPPLPRLMIRVIVGRVRS